MTGKLGLIKARLGQVLLFLMLALFLGGAVLVKSAAAFRFVFLGDSRTYGQELYNQEALKDLLREVKKLKKVQKHHFDFVVFGGDMARWGGTKHLGDWLSFMRKELRHELRGLKLYPVKGNHEIHAGDTHKSIQELDREYNQVFGLQRAYYTFTHGRRNQTLFVVLDTHEHRHEKNRDHPHISQGQLHWLRNKLHHARERQIIVIGHAPLQPMHGHQADASMKKLETLLKSHHKVVLYICGHDHDYQVRRLGSHLTQIICGNAGAGANVPWCFLVVDVDNQGVRFTGYRGKHGKYHADHHQAQSPPQHQPRKRHH
jgi:3',5'-cyclic AMP phosphodiesterase CpdA